MCFCKTYRALLSQKPPSKSRHAGRDCPSIASLNSLLGGTRIDPSPQAIMITLIKSLSHNKDQDDQPARPPLPSVVQLPPHVKASVREQAQDLGVFSDTGNGLASELAARPRDPRTLVIVDTDTAIMQCFATLKELRPHLEREGFLQQIKLQQDEGYR